MQLTYERTPMEANQSSPMEWRFARSITEHSIPKYLESAPTTCWRSEHVLEEQDGPTLRHSLQGIHHTKLVVPRRAAARPDPELLQERYSRFQAAS